VKKKPTRNKPGDVMRKVRKPVPPPSRVEEDLNRYHRERERERLRREEPVGEDTAKP
jgi:hypothetical protein